MSIAQFNDVGSGGGSMGGPRRRMKPGQNRWLRWGGGGGSGGKSIVVVESMTVLAFPIYSGKQNEATQIVCASPFDS